MKNVAELQNEFESIVKENIHRDGIENLLQYLRDTDFYRAPASTKYHGSYAGGLVEHSINVYYTILEELTFIYGKGWEQRYSKESATIVSLFHDLCKIGRYKPGKKNVKDPITGQWHEEATYFYNEDYTTMGHGSLSMFKVMQFIHLTEFEAGAIYWHMGAFDVGPYSSSGDLSRHLEINTLALALQRADMLTTFVVENEKFEPLDLSINN